MPCGRPHRASHWWGVPGVTIEATLLEVKINGASDSRAGPNALPPAVINFEASFNNGLDPPGLEVGTGPNPATDFITIDFTKRILAASGQITLALDFDDNGQPEISLQTFISFEQAFLSQRLPDHKDRPGQHQPVHRRPRNFCHQRRQRPCW